MITNSHWKLGPHVRPNNSDKTIDFDLIQVAWPFATWVGDDSAFWWLENYHAKHPNSPVCGRFTPGGFEDFYKNAKGRHDDPWITGHMYANLLMEAGVPNWVYWRTDEMKDDYWWIRDFNLAVMEKLVPAGYRWGAIMLSEGNPKQPPWDSIDEWSYFDKVFRAINEYGPSKAIAMVNAYRADGYDPAHLTRFAHPMILCENAGLNNVYWAFGETGTEIPLLNSRPSGADGDDWQFLHALQINEKLRAYPKLIGGAWFDFSNLSISEKGGIYRAYGDFAPAFIAAAKTELAKDPQPAPIPTPPPSPVPAPQPPPSELKNYRVVATDGVRIRGNPSASLFSPIKGKLPVDWPFQAKPYNDQWVIIEGKYYVAKFYNGVTLLKES